MAEARFSKAKLEKSLVQQLEEMGKNTLTNQELVRSYLYFYELQRKAEADVKTRGLTLVTENAKGETVEKQNPNVKTASEYYCRKEQILKTLGIQENVVKIIQEESDL